MSEVTDILYLTDLDLAGRAASTLQVASMARAWTRQDRQVTVTGFATRGALQPDGPRHIRSLPPPRRARGMAARWLAQFAMLRRRQALVYARSATLALAGARRGRRVILELHGLPAPGSGRARDLQALLGHRALRRIVPISQALAQDLHGRHGAPHDDCDVVVAHDAAEPGPRPGPPATRDGPLRVGYFGHLYPGKGMETIAELAPLLPDMRFEVYGGRNADIARWRHATAAQSNLHLHGHVPHEKVRGLMAECDILVAPYAARVAHAGGGEIGAWMSPLKLFEYMAAERPIVVSDLPVLREVATDGVTALMPAPDHAPDWAAALRRLATDRHLRDRLARAARDRLEKHHTWDARARRVLANLQP